MATWTARDILDSIEEGKFRLDQAKAETEALAQRRLDQQTANNEAAWAPIIARIKESIPEWAWQYLTHPNSMPTYRSEHVTMIVPATIDLEGMGLVFSYYPAMPGDPILFMPAEWHLQDDDEEWIVQPSNGRSESVYSLPGNPDFLIALAQAHANMEHYAEMKAEADRRNAERQKAKVETPPTRVEHDWVGLARLAVGKAMADGNEAAIAYALIGILEQLQKVMTPLYGGSQHAIQTFDNSRGQL